MGRSLAKLLGRVNIRMFESWKLRSLKLTMAQSIYRNLDIWKLSIELSKKVYILCSKFPKTEIYGLVDQMKRSSISIASNIAE